MGLYDLTPALCRLDYTMSEAGGVTNFVRQYTLASGGDTDEEARELLRMFNMPFKN